MKNIKRLAAFLVACAMLLAIGCSNQDIDIEQRMTDAYARMNDAKSVDSTIHFVLSVKLTSEEQTVPMQFQVNVESTAFKEPEKGRMKLSVSVFGFTQDIGEMYMETLEDGTVKLYSYNESTDTWTSNTDEAGEIRYLNNFTTAIGIDVFKSMEIVGTEQINGVEADVVECALDMDKIWDIVMGAAQSELTTGEVDLGEDYDTMMAGLKAAFSGAKYTVWLKQGTSEILKIKLDLSSLTSFINEGLSDIIGESLLGSVGMSEEEADGTEAINGEDVQEDIPDVEFTEIYLEVIIDGVNSSEPFDIPSEAYSAQPAA